MKKQLFGLALFGLTAMGSLSAEIIPLQALTQPEMQEMMEGKRPDLAVEFVEGTELNLHLFLKGSIASLLDDDRIPPKIQIHQTFYVRFEEGNFLFSWNAVEWLPFQSWATGELFAGLKVTEEAEPVIQIGANLYSK